MRLPRLGLAAALACALLAGGCGGDEEPVEKAPTSIADLDVTGIRIARAPFCDLVPTESVTAALGAKATSSRTWGNGDPVPGSPSDLAHELGCGWSAPSGDNARAWVFARPVDPAFARSTLASVQKKSGCRTRTEVGFGTPSLVQRCPAPGNATRIRYAGLLGNSWLTCEVTSHAQLATIRSRTDAWCAAVADALEVA
ncbi:hypothetical protein ABIE44_002991 [Marmoricola sp. OAE513]|uniref:hypothetical protein n=1 Tax=Marmoricola sp. OAE513 TaxID=2817894 RepID=UPI001AE5034A